MAQQQVTIEVIWKAFELRPEGTPRMDDAKKRMIERSWPQVQAMARQYGVVMNAHRFDVNTRLAHRAAKVVEAIAPAHSHTFNMALFRAYFELDQDISEPEILVTTAEGLGIDGAALREKLAAGEGLDAVLADEMFAYQNQLSGVPAFIFAEKYLVTGVQPPEQLVAIVRQVEELEKSG